MYLSLIEEEDGVLHGSCSIHVCGTNGCFARNPSTEAPRGYITEAVPPGGRAAGLQTWAVFKFVRLVLLIKTQGVKHSGPVICSHSIQGDTLGTRRKATPCNLPSRRTEKARGIAFPQGKSFLVSPPRTVLQGCL